MRFGYDDNLGLPPSVAAMPGIEVLSFHDIAAQVAAFVRGDLDACFAPAGAKLALAAVPHVVLAQAQVSEGGEAPPMLTTRLVVRRDADLAVPTDAVTRRVGYINEFCTTSYWAPMIALLDETPPGTRLRFCPADGFDDLLAGVVDGRTDAAMVWDQVLARHPDQAAATRVLGELGQLPGPLVYAQQTMAPADQRRLADAFLAAEVDEAAAYFHRFVEPDQEAIDAFARQMAAAQEHFDLGGGSAT